MKKEKIKFVIVLLFHIYIYVNYIIIYVYNAVMQLLIILVAKDTDSGYKLYSNEENKTSHDSHVTYIRTSIRNISRRAVNK